MRQFCYASSWRPTAMNIGEGRHVHHITLQLQSQTRPSLLYSIDRPLSPSHWGEGKVYTALHKSPRREERYSREGSTVVRVAQRERGS